MTARGPLQWYHHDDGIRVTAAWLDDAGLPLLGVFLVDLLEGGRVELEQDLGARCDPTTLRELTEDVQRWYTGRRETGPLTRYQLAGAP